MKVLTLLALLQTAILLLVLGKIVLSEGDATVAERAEQNTLLSDDLSHTQSRSSSGPTGPHADEDRLRQIIREELAAYADRGSVPANQADALLASSSPDNVENQYQLEILTQQLDYHTSVGNISRADMEMLQGEIAKLDERGRMAMLRKLSQAFNSGQLDGRL